MALGANTASGAVLDDSHNCLLAVQRTLLGIQYHTSILCKHWCREYPSAMPDQQSWREKAACSDLDPLVADTVFFIGRGQSSKSAKLFCSPCPVKSQCLAFAILHNEVGIWAGYTDQERQDLKIYDFTRFGVFVEYRHLEEWYSTGESLEDRRYYQTDARQFVNHLAIPHVRRPLDGDSSFLEAAIKLAEELLGAL